eukprot:3266019-Rhodomonas_salina.1
MFRANHGEAKPSPSKVVPPLWKKGEACLPACPRSSGAKHSMQLNLSGVGASDRDDTAKPDKVGFSHVRVIYRVVSDLLQFVELGCHDWGRRPLCTHVTINVDHPYQASVSCGQACTQRRRGSVSFSHVQVHWQTALSGAIRGSVLLHRRRRAAVRPPAEPALRVSVARTVPAVPGGRARPVPLCLTVTPSGKHNSDPA